MLFSLSVENGTLIPHYLRCITSPEEDIVIVSRREEGCRLTARERILRIRLFEKIRLQTEYAIRIGLQIKEENEKPKEARKGNA